MPAPLPPDLPPQRTMGPRPKVDWAAYHDRVVAEYNALLVGESTTELDIQRFFERNPSALPGAFPDGGGHGPYLRALISQPKLEGIGSRRPDFMWLTRNSIQICPVLIEIESPDKRWVAGAPRDPRPHHDLNQAFNQLRLWRRWFQEDANHQIFRSTYKLPPEWADRPLRPLFLLITGRTHENPQEIAHLRRDLTTEDVRVFTYDSEPIGEPEGKCDQFVTISSAGSSGFAVKHVPPTLTGWDSVSSEEWRAVSGREQAVLNSTEMSDEHKRLLIDDLALEDQHRDELDAHDAARAARRRTARP